MPIDSNIPVPLDVHREPVRAEWIDYNDHMNVAFYVLVFDHGTDALFDLLGLDEAYRRRTDYSTFALESHITYRAEVKRGDPLRVTSLLIGHDAKRLHFFHRMYHATEGYLAATSESVCLHVDLKSRKGAPFPPVILDRVAAVARVHASAPVPPELGRRVGLSRQSTV